MGSDFDWPETINAGKYEPSVNISTLTDPQKREVWEYLKTNHPDVAKVVAVNMADEMVLKLLEVFDAGILVEKKYLPKKFPYNNL